MMTSGDDEKSLSRLSTFAIQKGIQGLVGEPKTIKRLRSGDLLIEVDRETHSNKLLAVTELAQVPVKVSPHRTLNTSKGVLRTPELKNTTREELLTQLKKQGVTDARMVTIKKNGEMIRVNTAILTFNRPTPPATLKVGFERCTVQPYVPSPLRCSNANSLDTTKITAVKRRCARSVHNLTIKTPPAHLQLNVSTVMVNIRPIPKIVPDGLQRRKSNVFAQSERFPSLKLGKLLKGLANNHSLPVLSRSRLCRLVARLTQ